MTKHQYRVTVDANGNMDGWVRRALVQHLPVTPDRIKVEPLELAAPPTREQIADEVSGITIGSGYYSMMIGIDAAREVADIVFALIQNGAER